MRRAHTVLLLMAALMFVRCARAADLQPKTVAAFDKYVQATEQRIDKQVHGGTFLWLDSLPEATRNQYRDRIRRGEVVSEKLKTIDFDVPDGLIHHWVGAAFIPGKSVGDVVHVLQDYDRHPQIYKPEVVKAKVMSRNGNQWQVYMRLFKHKVISVYLDTYHDAHFFPLGANRFYSWSHSTRIQEVEEAGTPQEKDKPVGHDNGFLWRLNSYWRLEQKDGGVYIECEAISLTRDIPFGVKWLVTPFVTSIPHESLDRTLKGTRDAVAAK